MLVDAAQRQPREESLTARVARHSDSHSLLPVNSIRGDPAMATPITVLYMEGVLGIAPWKSIPKAGKFTDKINTGIGFTPEINHVTGERHGKL